LLVKTTYFIIVLPKHYAHRASQHAPCTVRDVLITNTFYDAIDWFSHSRHV